MELVRPVVRPADSTSTSGLGPDGASPAQRATQRATRRTTQSVAEVVSSGRVRRPEEKEEVDEREGRAAAFPEQVMTRLEELLAEESPRELARGADGSRRFGRRLGFIETLFDGDSFSRTIENIFYFSFLVKESRAALELDAEGDLVLAPGATQPGPGEERPLALLDGKELVHSARGTLSFVMDLDEPLWRELCEERGLRGAQVRLYNEPDRTSNTRANAQLQTLRTLRATMDMDDANEEGGLGRDDAVVNGGMASTSEEDEEEKGGEEEDDESDNESVEAPARRPRGSNGLRGIRGAIHRAAAARRAQHNPLRNPSSPARTAAASAASAASTASSASASQRNGTANQRNGTVSPRAKRPRPSPPAKKVSYASSEEDSDPAEVEELGPDGATLSPPLKRIRAQPTGSHVDEKGGIL